MKSVCHCNHLEAHHYFTGACSAPFCPCVRYAPKDGYQEPKPRRLNMPIYVILFFVLAVAPMTRAQDASPASGVARLGSRPVPAGVVGHHYGQGFKEVVDHPYKTADRKWWLTNAASWASTVADIENTQYCMRHGCREGNPLFFSSHPTRLRQYEVMAPIAALTTWLSYKWKREDEADVVHYHRRAAVKWYAPAITNIGVHSFGLAFTFSSTGR
jgi:hypothetical protein